MKKTKKEPIYIKLLKINYFMLYFKGISIGAIILNFVIWNHPVTPKHLYRYFRMLPKYEYLVQIYCWIGILVFFILFTIILEIIIIKTSNKEYPLTKKQKIYFIIFNSFYSNILLSNYLQYKKWSYEEYLKEQRNKSNTTNSSTEQIESENSSLINIDNKEENLKYYKYLQKKYKDVTIILANDNLEKYRIGKKLNDKDFLKNYIIVELNLKYYNYWWQTLRIRTWGYICMFSLLDTQPKPKWSFKLKYFGNNNYFKFFRTLKGMTSWISKTFPQFNRV